MTAVLTDVVQSRLKVLILERNTERARRGKKPLTTRRIAELVGISESTLTGITSNRTKRTDYETLQKLCRFFNCTPGDILEYIPENEDFREGNPVDKIPSQEEMGTYQGKYSLPVMRTLTGEVQKRLLIDPWLDVD
jgi:putative transcriptional regulator